MQRRLITPRLIGQATRSASNRLAGGLVLLWLVVLVLVPSGRSLAADDAALSPPSTIAIPIHDLRSQPLRNPAMHLRVSEALSPAALPMSRFRPLTESDANQGISGAHHWIHVRLDNLAGRQPMRWVLHHEAAWIDEIEAHLRDDSGEIRKVLLTDRAPFASRPIAHRTLAVEHETPAGGFTDVWLRLHMTQADALTLNVQLSRADLFHAATRNAYLIHGIYFGLMGLLLALTLLLAVALRQRVYLAYGVFLGITLLMWAMLHGFAFQYLWPGAVWLQNEAIHIAFLAVPISALWFSRLFLKTREHWPRIDLAIRVAMVVYSAAALLRLVGVHALVLHTAFFALCSLVLLSPLGWLAWRRGLIYARWYAVAWALYGPGLLLSVISAGSDWLSWGMEPLVFTQAAGVIEAVFLLLALGERFADWQTEHVQALRLANQDPLTGLGNRRALEHAMSGLRDTPDAAREPLFLIMMDLDHFKGINDRYGHEAGDKVLVDLATLLRAVCRPDDVCVRYGGEEFAVLLRVPGIDAAREVAERIRKGFEARPTVHDGATIEHTLTIGVGQISAAGDDDPVEAMFRQADRALYLAKRSGRNQIAVYQ